MDNSFYTITSFRGGDSQPVKILYRRGVVNGIPLEEIEKKTQKHEDNATSTNHDTYSLVR